MDNSFEKASEVHSSIKIERNIAFSKNYWTNQEQILYYLYVHQNFKRFQTEARRKQHKVFTVFSKILKTRSSYQIKSRHQLLLKRYKNLKNYLKEFEFENKMEIQQFIEKNERCPIFEWNFLSLNFRKPEQELKDSIHDEDNNSIKDFLEINSIQSINSVLPFQKIFFNEGFNQQSQRFLLIKDFQNKYCQQDLQSK